MVSNRDVILRYLLGKDERQWPASARECAAAAGISVSTAHYHLGVLQREGLVEGGSRGFRATRKEAA